MTPDYIGIGFSIIIFVLYFIALFLLFKIKARLTEALYESIILFRAAIIVLIFLRIQTVFRLNLLVPYFQEILALILAVVLLMAFYSIYQVVDNSSGKVKKGNKKWR